MTLCAPSQWPYSFRFLAGIHPACRKHLWVADTLLLLVPKRVWHWLCTYHGRPCACQSLGDRAASLGSSDCWGTESVVVYSYPFDTFLFFRCSGNWDPCIIRLPNQVRKWLVTWNDPGLGIRRFGIYFCSATNFLCASWKITYFLVPFFSAVYEVVGLEQSSLQFYHSVTLTLNI